ncbi:MAG TPA: hypothetical protein VLL25_07610 [Acidimicrobiales bacterium]|nr:hypothetical protein [Acidimicrobiales bacterium]
MAYATIDELAEALHKPRMTEAEVETAQRCVDAATTEIDNWVDAWPDLPPRWVRSPRAWDDDDIALINRTCLLRAVEWWKSTDAAFGIVGFADIGALRAPRDGFARHGVTLTALKQRWPVA